MLKRTFDVFLSIAAIILLFPVMLIVAIAVRLTSGAPILFVQQRVGKNLKLFDIYKFRTMVNSGVSIKKVEDKKNSLDELKKLRNEFQTTKLNDVRITKIGKILRRFYLDELPQLFNVLKGDMSIVGPRPDTYVQEADYSRAQWMRRHRVRPGITGLAQISSAADDILRTRIALDLKYVRCVSMCCDLRIMVMTLKRIVLKGSY